MNMKLFTNPNALLAAAIACGCIHGASATTVLSPNDVQIVAYASDAPDAIAFVTWVELAPGTEIRFTDKGWTDSGFRSGESELRFTAQATVPAGSVFEFEVGTTSEGPGLEWELLSGTFSLTGDPGDQIIVYQGDLASPTHIFAFDTTDGWEDCNSVTDQYMSCVPTGLVDGVSAVSFVHSDSFWYRPWYAKSALLETLKEWMVNRSRFKTTSTSATRLADYEAPLGGFTIRSGQRGANGYTEYIPGTGPCIILSGHDGDVSPTNIDDRNHGCWDGSTCDWSKTCSPQNSAECRAVTANDENTQDMARRANDYFEASTGYTCHLVVSRLARIKLDPNREVEQATQFDANALNAYNDFHSFASTARSYIENTHPCGAGLLMDFHGHTHPEALIELGYKLSSTQLRDIDSVVDTLAYTSSIKNMPTHKSQLFSEVVRGANSMGSLFELQTAANATGYLSVPSPTKAAPLGGESYFQGGYNVETHGSEDGGSIDGVQIEFPRYIRAQDFTMQEDMLTAFGEVVLPQMLALNYPAACDVLGNTPNPTANPTTAQPTTNLPTSSPTTSSPTTSSPTTPNPTNAVTPNPTDAPVFSGVCSDDGVTSCTNTDISQCACANRRNLLEVKKGQLRGITSNVKPNAEKQELFVSRMLAKPTCTDATCRKSCADCCPGGDCAAYESDCGPCTTPNPTNAVTPNPTNPATLQPTSSPTGASCSCNSITPNPTTSPTNPVTPNPTNAPTKNPTEAVCEAANVSCTDASVNCCNGCSGGKPANRVCL